MKEKFLRCLFLYTIFSVFCLCGFTQSVPKKVSDDQKDFKFLKQAQNFYEANEYGSALSYAEKAKNSRRQDVVWKIYVIQNLQKLNYVRKCGDDLKDLLIVLKEHNQTEAYNIINTEVEMLGLDYFNGSLQKVTDYINESQNYPEANYLIGKVYRLEGETELAEKYFLEAYKYRIYLDVPDVQYDILYDLADLCRYDNDMESYEKYLLLIVKDNPYYTDAAFMNAMTSILVRDNEDNAVEKFFLLYRCEAYFSIKALNALCDYYKVTGETDKALKCAALGSISAVSKIDNTLKSRLIRYSYANLGDLLDKAACYADILEWGNEDRIWELMYNFGDIMKGVKPLNAIKMFQIYEKHMPEEYWKQRSGMQLIK